VFRRANTAAMTPGIRRFLSFLSACAIAASILAYIYSFFGAPVDKILPWLLLLFFGFVALTIPMFALEYPASKAWNWTWKEWTRGMPSWVAPCSWLLQLVFVVHLAWAFVQSGPGVPGIVDGQYVIESGGRILKVLTQAEYIRLREATVREGATAMIAAYFPPMTYWWFRQSPPHRE
jgi:hypothetical protein